MAKTLYKLGPAVFGSTQHTPIFFDGHLYGVREKDKQLVCLDLDGRVVWSSGSQHRFGIGPYMIAGGLIYVMDDAGRLTLAEATPEGYKQLAQAQVLDGQRFLGADGPGRRPPDRPRFDADDVLGRGGTG